MQRNALCLILAGLLAIDLSSNSEATADENTAPSLELSGDARASLETTDSDEYRYTRLRVQAQMNPTENISLTSRIHLSKLSNSESQDDDNFWIDRMFLNWDNIARTPFSFQAGRLPTMEGGGPAYLRLGLDKPQGSFSPFTDFALDGVMLGYMYAQPWPGSISFFYYGPQSNANRQSDNRTLDDTDIAGLSWDIYKKGNRFLNLQSFAVMDLFNVPSNTYFSNPLEFAAWEMSPDTTNNLYLDRMDMGNIYHTSAVFTDKLQKLNYFVAGAWSRPDPKGMDEMGTSLLGSWWDEPKKHNGYNFHVGLRYDLDDYGLKLGTEYNHGSKYWVGFVAPGHNDMYQSKLATRGNVYEIYGIYDLPFGEAVSQFGKAWIRLGYQHYDYKYTGSGSWLGAPQKIEDLQNDPMAAQFYTPIDHMDQVYLTFDVSFGNFKPLADNSNSIKSCDASTNWASGFYATGSIGQTRIDNNDLSTLENLGVSVDDTDTGYSTGIGYEFNKYVAFEGGYADLGEATATYSGAVSGTINGTPFSATGTIRAQAEADGFYFGPILSLPVTDKFSIYAKAGLFIWDVDTSASAAGTLTYGGNVYAGSGEATVSDNGTDAYFGAGIAYDVTQTLSVKTEWTRFQIDSDSDSVVDFVSAGLVFKFGKLL